MFLDKNAHWQLAQKLRDVVKYDKSKHTMAAPNTSVTSHTSLFIVWHLQLTNCAPKKIPKSSMHYKIPDLI